jgi:S-adenosylmethionine/arginine decarboxylase-like enzyme
MTWGYHLILDCGKCNRDMITSDDSIKDFFIKLIPMIGMTPVGDPMIEYLLPKTPNAGFSAMQMISTSNITAHFVDATCEGYIDLFSCKKFDPAVVKQFVQDWFKPETIKETWLERQA